MILSARSRQLGESKKIGLAVRVSSASFVSSLILFLSFLFISGPAGAQAIAPLSPSLCKRTITADVVALSQPIMLNRLGAAIPDGLVFALKKDTVPGIIPVRLKDTKRPRPLVLRANVGDCLRITFTNSIPANTFSTTKLPLASTGTNEVSFHVQGMQWVTGPEDDGSFVGKNNSSLATPSQTRKYTLYAKAEGTFLLYTMGDTSTTGLQLMRGLFGALNVQPAKAEWYRSQVTADDLARATYNAKSLPANASISAGACTAAAPCTLTFTGPNARQIKVIKTAGGSLNTTDNYPLINYDATDANGTPILKMLDAKNKIVHSDLTAMITGPNAGRFPGANGNPNKPDPPCNAENNGAAPPGGKIDPLFCQNPASPDRKQPYREITVIYHGGLGSIVSQAFPILSSAGLNATQAEKDTAAMTVAGQDAFAINYGTGGIGAEIYANRVGVGPMGDCVDCKFEEFFLSAWSVGDPAMLVDRPANSMKQPPPPPSPAQPPLPPPPPLCTTAHLEGTPPSTPPNPDCANARQPDPFGEPYTLASLAKAARVYYPDDPSNVYHSYINDHVKFRILHGGTDVTHAHHQHAHQWLQSPNSDQGSYLDSQMISPGASYTLEMTYNGSGNRNKVVGDSIFHCHFYPHFAAGMWAMWRTHDVFESGTLVYPKDTTLNGKDVSGQVVPGSRALPDGEIKAGTPNPAIVPLPTLPMAPLPSPVFIDQGQIVYGTPATPDKTGQSVTVNPGYPFFIPGRAGARAPHPPLDFAPDGAGGFMDGGLPRHVVTGGSVKFESHDLFDWSKDLETVNATELAEDGTPVEKVAISFFSKRCYPTSFPDGTPGSCPSPPAIQQKPPTGFIVNGLPLGPQRGAPFADPAVDDDGNAVGVVRVYKAAAIEMDVVFNKKRWHYPQQRLLTLWDDVAPTIATTRKTEPLFFRGNSGDIIEYWHTNLVPNYYQVDDFQVRTPTDVLGQHIHLVKFDVTSSDGAGNGFNYEDGTFAPEEVQELITAINEPGGSWTPCLGCAAGPPALKPPPAQICGPQPPAQCASEWKGAQTTVQRWYLDPLVDNSGVDRTLRTVFTHDHFGPSTHQQAGLYAGLVVEPKGSTWTSNDGATPFGSRSDGGPTSWEARIITSNTKDSYREFLLEFQDLQLAYAWATIGSTNPPKTQPSADPKIGWIDPAYAINAPSGSLTQAKPTLVTTGTPGTLSVNYRNEPIAWRVGAFGDMSSAFDSSFKLASNLPPNGDPGTPLMRAYQNDNVQVRILVGAHLLAHQFNLEGPTWFSEPSWKNSGYRSAQGMALSEHFEMLFRVPSSSAPNNGRACPDGKSPANCVDYLYSPSLDEIGVANGMWGLFRSYDPTDVANKLQPLPNNPIGPAANVTYATCPAILPPPAVKRVFNVTAVTAQKALANITSVPGSNPPRGQIVFNRRDPTLRSENGVLYVRTEDLDAQGRLEPGVPVEPLILRANAGDCIEVNLTNALESSAQVFQVKLLMAAPFNFVNPVTQQPVFQSKMSGVVGLHPQLLSYDGAQSNGMNVGWNRQDQTDQVVGFGKTIKYQWYAGKIDRDAGGNLVYTPVEFGSLNLFPSDPVYQHINGLFGAMIIEPQGSTWQCGDTGSLADCDPSGGPPPKTRAKTRASATITLQNATKFREFALMISDNFRISNQNSGAVNYRTEPQTFRYANNTTTDFSCMLSNQLIQQAPKDPQTPIFTAEVGDRARFRLMHPFGTGTSQVFSLHGHVWQRNPYRNDSREMGDNSLSQWIGSRDNHGSTDHFDILVDKAGGKGGRAGDYLYTVFVPNQARQGAWGIFRVGDNKAPSQPNAACSPIAPLQRIIRPVVPKKNDLDRFIRQPVNKDPGA